MNSDKNIFNLSQTANGSTSVAGVSTMPSTTGAIAQFSDSLGNLTSGIQASTIVDMTSTQVVTNKELDTHNTIVDVSDNTKVLAFRLNGQTTGTTTVLQSNNTANHTLTLPNATDTLVGNTTSATLTNKTLTAPIISTITNTGTLTLSTHTGTIPVNPSSVTSGNIPAYNGIDGSLFLDSGIPSLKVVTTDAAQTLSNKQLINQNTFHVDNSDNTKTIKFSTNLQQLAQT
jgi:hypothetical protein